MIIPNIWKNKKCSKPPTSESIISIWANKADFSNRKGVDISGKHGFFSEIAMVSQHLNNFFRIKTGGFGDLNDVNLESRH
jgi:hypothetical protein